MPNITALTALLNKGQDSALLRFGLASAYLKEQPDDHLIQAEEHLKRCLALDPTYTAAYQQLAQVQKDRDNLIDATETLRSVSPLPKAQGTYKPSGSCRCSLNA